MLTSYDGQAITYDEIGNPLTFGDWTYTWEHGRQLASVSDGDTTWTYTYSSSGVRRGRTNGTDTYEYVYSDGQLKKLTVNNTVLYFSYDAQGRPMSVKYSGHELFYVLNIQGDVLGVVDIDDRWVVKYTYDAWGNILSIDGSMKDTLGVYNPLRYRGYVYDQETGLYYLQSRYYNPEIGRFINADTYVSTGQGILGNNAYSYCQNNPVQYADPQGTFICTITGAIVGGIIGAINAAISGDDVLAGALIGAGTGALAGAAADVGIATGGVGAIAIAAAGGALANGLNYVGNEHVNGREISYGVLAVEMTVGAVANLLTFGAGGGSATKVGGKVLSNMCKKFKSTIFTNTTKVVGGKVVSKSAATVAKHIVKNSMSELAETAAISWGAWANSKVWGGLIS